MIDCDNYINCSHIKFLSIVSPTEILLFGKNFSPIGKSLELSDGINRPLTFNYYPNKDTFILEFGQINIGSMYVVSSNWIKIPKNYRYLSIPKLLKVIQLNKKEVKLIFNIPVERSSSLNSYNYWIGCNKPGTTSIATLGENDSRTFNNSLKPYNSFVKVTNYRYTEFIITFSREIEKGIKYKVMPYNICTKGFSDYIGPNFIDSDDITFTSL